MSGSPTAFSAVLRELARLLHHAHVVVAEGPSLRLAKATAGKR